MRYFCIRTETIAYIKSDSTTFLLLPEIHHCFMWTPYLLEDFPKISMENSHVLKKKKTKAKRYDIFITTHRHAFDCVTGNLFVRLNHDKWKCTSQT